MVDGSHKRMDEIEVGDVILANDGNGIVPRAVSHLFEPNEKELFEITLQSGRILKCSADHDVLGWAPQHGHKKKKRRPVFKRMGDWNVGEYLATHLGYSGYQQTLLNLDEVRLAAYMIGDGSCGEKTLQSGKIGFTNNREDILEDFCGILDSMHIPYYMEDKANNTAKTVCITGIKVKNCGISDILERYQVLGKLSYEKKIPDIIRTASKKSQREFIRALYSTDGWASHCKVGKNVQAEIGYCTTSEQLALGLQDLLSSFGIVSKIQTRDKRHGAYANARTQYIVKIRSFYYVLRFLAGIGFINGKEKECEELFHLVQYAERPKDYKAVVGNIYLDKIKSIESIGTQKCYDISIDQTHNFFANGICVHNSADRIYLDEVDYMGDEAIVAIMAIMLDSPDTTVWGSSTPTGKREMFFRWCTDKKLNWEQFHYPASMSPTWSKEIEFEFRNTCTEQEYLHEYEAEFGEEVVGVFQHTHIEKCLKHYWYTKGKHYNEEGEYISHPGIAGEWNPKNIYGPGS
jgi:intein/homing endonuclease